MQKKLILWINKRVAQRKKRVRVKHTHAIHAYMIDLLQSQFFSLFYPIAATTTSFLLRCAEFTCSWLRRLCNRRWKEIYSSLVVKCEGGGTLKNFTYFIYHCESHLLQHLMKVTQKHTRDLPSLINSSLMTVIYLYMLLHTRYVILMTVSDMKNLRNEKQFVRSSAGTLSLYFFTILKSITQHA